MTGKWEGESGMIIYKHKKKNLCTCLIPGRREGKQRRGRLGSGLFVDDITVQADREGRSWLIQEVVISTG